MSTRDIDRADRIFNRIIESRLLFKKKTTILCIK